MTAKMRGRTSVVLIMSFLVAHQGASLLLEVVHGHGWESACSMVLCLVMVDLMDWDGSVNHMRLNSLLLHNWLNGFVHVMVDMLSSNDRCHARRLLAFNSLRGVAELSLLVGERLFHLLCIVMFVLPMLDRDDVVVVLLVERLRVLNRLHGSVVVILVALLLNC